ncbi:putative bifunctional diguanylate cyclase/phosphodiesterase [Natronospira bacteriovora]|uniref:EAL domain-containing protein n=1 Tax=Natronospira bacteriovora TaxID=3069753 RepID=A0ABU0W6N4_9GAMM|nr:EAL domain-containing protein [Natronospira sp. AB-CW4]MDQ2069684.1 EAL domain-containing protein [Natronospira sp. AB-CW4]
MLIQTLHWLVIASSGLCPGGEPLSLPKEGRAPVTREQQLALADPGQEWQAARLVRDKDCDDLRPARAFTRRGQRHWIALDASALAEPDILLSGWGLHVPAMGFRELCVHWPLVGEGWHRQCAGNNREAGADAVRHQHRIFLAPEGMSADRNVLISAQSPFFALPPIEIASASELLSAHGRSGLFTGAAYGILLSIVIYGLLLLGTTRNLSLLYFSGYFGLFALALFLAEGLHLAWFGIGTVIGGTHLAFALLGVALLAGTLFLGHFLRSRHNDPWQHLLLWVIGIVGPGLMWLAALRLDWTQWASETGALVFAFGGLAATAKGVLHGRRNAGPLLIGFVILSLALVINSLVRLGWLPSPGMNSIDILKSALLLGGMTIGLAAEREFSNLRRQRDRASLLAETHQRIALYRVDYDGVTGLPNRRRFFKLVSERVANVVEGQGVGVIRIEFTDFRRLRHLHGQEVAEDLLRQLVARLQRFENSGRVLGRTETDEFSLLLPLPGTESAAESILDALAGDIHAAVSEGLTVGSEEIRVQCVMGGSHYPLQANSGEQLLVQAEAGLFESREAEHGAFHLFGRNDGPGFRERWSMGRRLTAAMEAEEIRVHYQPIVDLAGGGIRQLEALARWTDPEFGEISPGIFIPVAENLGIIETLSRQLVRQACRDFARWQALGILGATKLSLNLSPLQLRDPHFEDWLLDTIAEHGLTARQVSLEITENTLVENLATARDRLQRLADQGMGISVDDFGVGYSSLSYIRELPIDTLKIDRSFMGRLSHSEAEREILRSLLTMARRLRLSVVAEGIEYENQAAFLRRHGCPLGQGFLFSRPQSAEAIAVQLRRKPGL